MSQKTIECNLCKKKTRVWIDGKIAGGPWADMCPACHKIYGVGLGTGKGQKYQFDSHGMAIKLEG